MLTNVFIAQDQMHGDRLMVSGGDAAYLCRVLRLGPGDCFAALDGSGTEYRARILTLTGDGLEALIEARTRRETEARLRITLGQALPKGDKMEQVIRKCTELGLAEFWPVLSERCIAVPRDTRAASRLARWRRVALEAARQSGRGLVPDVALPRSWDETVSAFPGFDLVLLPWEGESVTTLKGALAGRGWPTAILALIGPEGGLTRPEVDRARSAGAITVTLGPRILRTETAGLVLGAALLYHYDELAWPPRAEAER